MKTGTVEVPESAAPVHVQLVVVGLAAVVHVKLVTLAGAIESASVVVGAVRPLQATLVAVPPPKQDESAGTQFVPLKQ
jgi:hypothetical protein